MDSNQVWVSAETGTDAKAASTITEHSDEVPLMARGKLTFKQHDLQRALRAARAVGLPFAQVRVSRDGEIVVIPSEPAAQDHPELNGLDEWLARQNARKA